VSVIRCFCGIIVIVAASSFGTISAWAQELPGGFPSGLHAKYTAGEKTIHRIDPDLSFAWGKHAPDQRLPAGPVTAEWTGRLLVKKTAAYTFHAYVAGEVTVEIDGQRLLSGNSTSPKWVSGQPVELSAGFRHLRVRYHSGNSFKRAQVFWSAERFPLEPLPPRLLFRPKPQTERQRAENPARHGPQTWDRIETGRVLYDVHRCNRCHRRKNEPLSPPGPDLTHVAAGLSASEIAAKVRNPQHRNSQATMPSFGFSQTEADAVAAFLQSVSKPVKLRKLPKPRKKNRNKPKRERHRGEILVRSVGCLACHTVGKLGNSDPYSGGDLTRIGEKRSPEWLFTWLSDPAKLNRNHRMPVIKLSAQERRQITVYLASGVRQPAGQTMHHDATERRNNPGADTPGSPKTIDWGRKLVQRAGCAACHRIPGITFRPAKLPDLAEGPFDGATSCLKKTPVADAPGLPKNGVERNRKRRQPVDEDIDIDAVKAFLTSRRGKLSPLSDFEAGQRVLERRNCTACHPRGLQNGIVETAGRVSKLDQEFAGQSQLLIPPSLNAVGDKLRDEPLKTAITGKQKTVRLPWLQVRMPRFEHAKEASAALVSYLIAHDRIPDGLEASAKRQADLPADSQVLVAGQTLLGIRGFSCIACHAVDEYEPRNTAPGTRGSDLMQLANRMRRSFFDRWTRNAIRIVPGMEMPSYHNKPVPGVLNDDVDLQLAVLWKALNDERFKPPTNPSVVEQFLTVNPGEPAHIVRDVFTVPEENGGGYVARSWAIGLNNGHNLLFDLDTYGLRGWYFGDFARQFTQGKSWYWEMAGVPVMTGFRPGFDIALLPKKGKSNKLIVPVKHGQRFCELLGYAQRSGKLVVEYVLWFEVDGKVHPVGFREIIQPGSAAQSNGRSGWQRTILVHGPRQTSAFGNRVTGHHHVLVARPRNTTAIGSATIEAVKHFQGKWQTYPGIKDREFIKMGVSAPASNETPQRASPAAGPNGRTITLGYTTTVKREQSKIELKPKRKKLRPEPVTSAPGFTGVRLPLPRSIMPTAMTWLDDGRLAFTSLKGDVFIATDNNGDAIEDRLRVFEEGLAAPYGIVADGKRLLVSHKPEIIRLRNGTGDKDATDGRANDRRILATGWGYTDNYHDWTTGLVRDKQGNLYVGLGSDYAQPKRPKEHSRWRGKVLKISSDGTITPVGHSFRYPMGLAMNHAGEIFVTDNQGVQNTFNEINHLQPGKHYGVPSRYEENRDAPVTPPAIQLPHPWTRSVNGIFFLPQEPPKRRPTSRDREGAGFAKRGRPLPDGRGSATKTHFVKAFSGHGIGCEYDNRFLIRFTLQQVDGVYQGACYAFSKPNRGAGGTNFTGPLCGGVAPDGAIYIGNISDSGWLGGNNTGDIVRLVPNGKLPNGIRELRVTKDGFELEFIRPVNHTAAMKPDNYSLTGYTRVWKGGYATPDSDRHTLKVSSTSITKDNRTVRLTVPGRRTGRYVYEVTCGNIGTAEQPELFPTTGYYTLHRIPR